MLKYLSVPYEEHPKSAKTEPVQAGDIRLTCSDTKIIIRNPSCLHRLIFGGMVYYNTSPFLLEEMDQKDAYYAMLESRNMSTNYLKGIDTYFDLFVDPMTRDLLMQMGEPTDERDLLIRAATLLTTEDHEPAASISNSMIRSYSRLPAAVHSEMAHAYSTYKNGALKATNKFSINPQAVYQRLLSDQLMVNTDVINPVHEVKRVSQISHMGNGGRSLDTFMVDDRRFTEDSIGVVSEATVDSGKVGVTASLSVNPNITTLSGLAAGVDPAEVTPAQLLSITGLLVAGTTHDDSKRAM